MEKDLKCAKGRPEGAALGQKGHMRGERGRAVPRLSVLDWHGTRNAADNWTAVRVHSAGKAAHNTCRGMLKKRMPRGRGRGGAAPPRGGDKMKAKPRGSRGKKG